MSDGFVCGYNAISLEGRADVREPLIVNSLLQYPLDNTSVASKLRQSLLNFLWLLPPQRRVQQKLIKESIRKWGEKGNCREAGETIGVLVCSTSPVGNLEVKCLQFNCPTSETAFWVL